MSSAQRPRTSLVEAVANTLVGYGIAVGAQVLVFPLFGILVPLLANLEIGLIFTGISVARSYVLRRVFERLRVSGWLP